MLLGDRFLRQMDHMNKHLVKKVAKDTKRVH